MFTFSKFEHHYDKSYFKYTEPLSDKYTVTVNGIDVPVYTCRISKIPFNRTWPGYQRSASQSMLVSFVSLQSDEALDIKVQPLFDYEKIMIKPYSKNIGFKDNNGEISFKLTENGQFVFTADDFSKALYIFNKKLIPAPKKEDVTYYFGPGVHMPGKITLKDNESVYVDKDALVFGSVYAENAKNLHIFGNGLFDDSCEGRIDNSCYENFTNGNLKLYDCENLRIEGVLFRDSAIWCVNIFHCFDVVVDNISVFGQWRYNTDGIDVVNCQDITFKNCFIHSFDDTVSIKGIDRYCHTNNENMIFENCVFWNDWGSTCSIGVETLCREYKNIVFRNIDIIRGGAMALTVNNGEFAEVSDILFEDIRVEYNSFDLAHDIQVSEDDIYEPTQKNEIPALIKLINIPWRTKENAAIWGLPEPSYVTPEGITPGCVHDVTARNIKVFYDEELGKKDGVFYVPIEIKSYRDDVEFYNINISCIEINGEKIDGNYNFLTAEKVKNLNFTK